MRMKKRKPPLVLAFIAALGAITGALIYQAGLKQIPFLHALRLTPITFCTAFILMWVFYKIRCLTKREEETDTEP